MAKVVVNIPVTLSAKGTSFKACAPFSTGRKICAVSKQPVKAQIKMFRKFAHALAVSKYSKMKPEQLKKFAGLRRKRRR